MACSKEVLKGYVVPSPAVKTLVALDVNHSNDYGVITVYNQTDKDITVEYVTTSGHSASCIVPNGQVFTRLINGIIAINTLYVTPIGGAATGDVIINLGNK